MSNVLVIEPRKILQHATAIALFPEHEARLLDAIPEAALLEQCDAVIIDAVALRERNALSAEALHQMNRWNFPIVWIDGDRPQAPSAPNITIVKRPVSRDELRAAVATSLGRQLLLRGKTESSPAAASATASAAGKMIRPKPSAAAAQKSQVIELVEVVEASGAEEEKEKK
jgi:hypothetical protein